MTYVTDCDPVHRIEPPKRHVQHLQGVDALLDASWTQCKSEDSDLSVTALAIAPMVQPRRFVPDRRSGGSGGEGPGVRPRTGTGICVRVGRAPRMIKIDHESIITDRNASRFLLCAPWVRPR